MLALERTNKALLKISLPSISATRTFTVNDYPHDDGKYKGQIPKRHGYAPHHFNEGLLPRLRLKEAKIGTQPMSVKESDWSNRKAMMGKDDFINILGDDEDAKLWDQLDNVPEWLRGYKDTTSEYGVLMRKRKEFDHWKITKPLKWQHMQARIKFLYRRINNKYVPPDVEKLHRSRYS